MKRGIDQSSGRTPKKRRPSSTAYYGQISLVEHLGQTGDADAGKWLVELDCFSAEWFDQFQADLGDLPDWHQVAQQARSRIVELTETTSELRNLFRPLGEIYEPDEVSGYWLEVRLYDVPGGDEGIPVALYVPPGNATDPSVIAIAGPEVPGVRLESVTLPSDQALAKLRRLSALVEGG